eukprot:gene4884-biopygen5221
MVLRTSIPWSGLRALQPWNGAKLPCTGASTTLKPPASATLSSSSSSGVSKAEVSETFAASSSRTPVKWKMSLLSSVASRMRSNSFPPPHTRADLLQSAISMPPPEDTLPSSIPDSPEALHRYLTSHFDSLFAAATSHPPPHLDPLSWEIIQSWPSFRSSFSHLGVPASDQSSVLWHLWDALCNVPSRAAVADDLLAPDALTPSLEEFLSCLRDKNANTAGGPTGLDYRTFQAWPAPMKHMAYKILSGFWSHKTLASHFKWRWLVPIPKPSATTITDFRPIMLMDVLRKLWTSLVVARLVSTLLNHKLLSSLNFTPCVPPAKGHRHR